MNIQRFTAPTAREALAKARLTFGDGTLILSNRPTSSGVEVVATGEDTLADLDRNELARQGKPQTAAKPMAPVRANPDSQVLDDTTQMAMSTLSFQDYVRERMLRRRQESLSGQPQATMQERLVQPERVAARPVRPALVQIAPLVTPPVPPVRPVQRASVAPTPLSLIHI